MAQEAKNYVLKIPAKYTEIKCHLRSIERICKIVQAFSFCLRIDKLSQKQRDVQSILLTCFLIKFYHVNFTITYESFEQNESFATILQICSINSKDSFILLYFARIFSACFPSSDVITQNRSINGMETGALSLNSVRTMRLKCLNTEFKYESKLKLLPKNRP